MDLQESSTREPIKGAEFIGPFRLGEQIGKGGMAVVKVGTYVETDLTTNSQLKKVAIKIIPKIKLANIREQTSVAREITIMKLLYHPNILQLFDLYEDKTRIFLILEYWPGGDLYRYVSTKGPLKLSHARTLFLQLLDVDFCHQNQIFHRDLKPENLLLSRDAKWLVLSDFGLSTATQGTKKFLTTRCGSVHYISPEVAAGSPYEGNKSDIWSCGIILYAMTTASLPFEAPVEILKKVVKGEFIIPEHLPVDLQSLISEMLVVDPNERPSISSIRETPWVKAGMGSINVQPIPHRSPRITPLEEKDIVENDAIIENLILLGWEREELKQKLLSQGVNDAKVFYALLRDHQKGQIKAKQALPCIDPEDHFGVLSHRRRAVSSSAGLTVKKSAKPAPKINISGEPRSPKGKGKDSETVSDVTGKASSARLSARRSAKFSESQTSKRGKETSPGSPPKELSIPEFDLRGLGSDKIGRMKDKRSMERFRRDRQSPSSPPPEPEAELAHEDDRNRGPKLKTPSRPPTSFLESEDGKASGKDKLTRESRQRSKSASFAGPSVTRATPTPAKTSNPALIYTIFQNLHNSHGTTAGSDGSPRAPKQKKKFWDRK